MKTMVGAALLLMVGSTVSGVLANSYDPVRNVMVDSKNHVVDSPIVKPTGLPITELFDLKGLGDRMNALYGAKEATSTASPKVLPYKVTEKGHRID